MYSSVLSISFSFSAGWKLLNIKFHAQAFTKGMSGAGQIRNLLGRAKTLEEIKKIMTEVQ